SQEIVIALVMVTAPNPPGSRQLISPFGAVFEMAPAKVLHGAVRLQGFASSPTPETQVRVACARAGAEQTTGSNSPAIAARNTILRIGFLRLLVTTTLNCYTTNGSRQPKHATQAFRVNWSRLRT